MIIDHLPTILNFILLGQKFFEIVDDFIRIDEASKAEPKRVDNREDRYALTCFM